jgi:dUTP pyrophosphatase
MRSLFLYVADNNLRAMYHDAASIHNIAIEQNEFSDSGFDLLLPRDCSLEMGVNKIDYEVKTAMFDDLVPCAYCIYARSSIYKTPLRMANSVGIIDSGYRGNLASVFDVYEPVNLKKNCRLTQICSPDLMPFRVVVVDLLEELGTTQRGEGGFGSTGV